MLPDAGHEFLETVRSAEIWSKAKAGATRVGSWSLSVIGDLAKGYLREEAAKLGLPL